MRFSILAYFAFVSQFSLGIVFLLSALPKLRRPLAFTRSVVAYEILPDNVAYLFALILIPLEVFLAIALLTGVLTDIALLLALVLLTIFLVAIWINLKRGRRISCGCFGETSEQISPRTLARLFLLLAVVLFLVSFRNTGGASLPHLGAMTANGSTLIYLLQSVFVAVFLILLGAWMLNLPELALLVRYWRGVQLLSGDTKDRNEMEVI
jgi:hypothetical protein